MDSTENCVCWHRNRNLLISTLIVLLVSSMTIVRFTAHKGRSIPKLVEAAQVSNNNPAESRRESREEMGKDMGERSDRVEAAKLREEVRHLWALVQVPIVPRVRRQRRSPLISDASHATHSTTIAYSRDGVSNYKPMCWKCKCGDFIFNP
ncbi:EPIDERMAL PATTERNING FACTOR-like protein 2 [Carya illinoinensis]|uniref:EPIDERMAL PATTERNING FACTOR-like protein 2 n=1 Tax=Carya illinoinensis TaxID=32201 RepID=UPI001C71C93F|nr:EPIDERMAL PATTERNING FACTOR-like protein 2 [Carya illinoinensis]